MRVRDSSALVEGTRFSFRIPVDGDSRPEAADVELLCGAFHLGVVGLEVSWMTGAILSELLVFLLPANPPFLVSKCNWSNYLFSARV